MDEKYFCIPRELFLSLSCGLQEPSSPSSSLPSVAILTQAFIALGFVERSIAFSRSCPRHLWTITFASLHLAMPLPCAHAPRGHAKLWKLVKSLQAGKKRSVKLCMTLMQDAWQISSRRLTRMRSSAVLVQLTSPRYAAVRHVIGSFLGHLTHWATIAQIIII